jgi:hypothetical protein
VAQKKKRKTAKQVSPLERPIGECGGAGIPAGNRDAPPPGELELGLPNATSRPEDFLHSEERLRMTDYERFGDYQASDRSSLGIALTFLFIGLGAGALSALLFAPKSGRQMRKMLRRKYEDARDVFDNWSEQAGDVIEKGQEWASVAKERVAPIARSAMRR